MSNHVHYPIEPRRPDEMPRVMHWLNWYTAMGLNRLLGRRGHFWEARYHASWVSNRDQRHVLNVLRYIHGNPFAAASPPGIRSSFVWAEAWRSVRFVIDVSVAGIGRTISL